VLGNSGAGGGLAKTGYHFIGWSGSANQSVATYIPGESSGTIASINSDIDFYPVFEANTYKVAYDKNAENATGNTAGSSHTYGTAANLAANGYSRANYTFTGWNTVRDGSGTAYTDRQSVMNLTAVNEATITLYAQWAEIPIIDAEFVKGTEYGRGDNVVGDDHLRFSGLLLKFVATKDYYDEILAPNAARITYISVDGQGFANTLRENIDYELKHGSTMLTLYDGYLDTLSNGRHVVYMHYDDGVIISGEFTISELLANGVNIGGPSNGSWSSATGDDRPVSLWVFIAIATLLGIVILSAYLLKTKRAKLTGNQSGTTVEHHSSEK
jgi:uncharacterized repeat protein (TIGR02543 family)